MLDAAQIRKKADALRQRHRETDQIWENVRAAREGRLDILFPDAVIDEFPQAIVANFVDAAARDLAETFAALPTFTCAPGTMSDAARKHADKRTKIVNYYVEHSQLGKQMLYGADQYLTYSRCVFYLEPDFEASCPRAVIEDPVGGYPEIDRWDRVISYTKRYYVDAATLAELYPEHAQLIEKHSKLHIPSSGEPQIELIRYCDAQQISLVMVAGEPIMLEHVENRLGETPVVIARRPWLDPRRPKGQFDDVIWVQVARNILATLQLQATEKQVLAPLAIPNDVQEIAYGPDATIRTATPEKVQRVGLEMGTAAFAQQEQLLMEMRHGARYPEARTGGIDASIITGKGVEALMGAFDAQIKTAHEVFRIAFTDVIRLMFKMDERYWPNKAKKIRGQANGAPYEIIYTPSKDIAGDHTVDVSYGFATGMDPNRAVVMMLQLRAEKVFSRDYFARQLPFPLDVSGEQAKVQVEEGREALLQSIYALAQAIPALAQMGADPSLTVHQLAQTIKGLQKGRPVEDVVSEVFAPPPPPEPEPEPAGPQPGGPEIAGPAAGGGLPAIAARPPRNLQEMLASLTGAGASMAARTRRQRVF